MTPIAHAITTVTQRLTLSTRDEARLECLAARVAAGEPLQYVLGEAWFWGRCFKVDRRALIPRPETEELVQRVLDDAELWRKPRPVMADVGVGTGCMVLTLAAERPQAELLGLDICPDALALARENEVRLGLAGRVRWCQADLLEGVPPGSLDAVVSNPPYIASGEIATLAEEVRAHEPRRALDGGVDGLDLVRRLIAQAVLALRPGGRVWMEIGDEQGESARHLLATAGLVQVETRRDLAGKPRMVEGVRP